MKLKPTAAILLLVIFFAVSACGCDIADFGTDNLLRPPKTMGDEAEIEQLIASTAKNGYTLKYPKSGNYRSAIVMADLNRDKTQEAVAFYSEGKDTAQIHMLVMYSDNGKWKLSSNSTTETTDIDSVDFADVDGDKTLEIIAGYTTYSTNINRLACYSYSDGKTVEIKSGQNYSSFYCGDFDNDGTDEIISLLLYTTENASSATMIDYSSSEHNLYSKASVPMDPNIVKYKNVTVSSFDDKTKAVVIDGSFATEELNTQIIYYSNDLSLLRNPLYSEKKKNITQRSSPVISYDVDSDGFVEIPVVTKLPHSNSESSEVIADKIEWNSFSAANESTTPKLYMAANYNFGYTIRLADKWLNDSVTARLDIKKGTMDFYLWNKNKIGDMLFEIKVFELADWDIGKSSDEYTLISKDDKYAYTFVNKIKDNKYSISDDEIKTAFSALTETVV